MSLISAGSISLDSTFKCFIKHKMWLNNYKKTILLKKDFLVENSVIISFFFQACVTKLCSYKNETYERKSPMWRIYAQFFPAGFFKCYPTN